MATISSTKYVIAVNDLMKSAEYYRDVLGFTIQEIGDDGWRFLVKDACTIMAGHCPDAIPPKELGDHSYFAYIDVDGIDEYFEQVQANGGNVLQKLADKPWGMREFAIETIDGHRIMFGCPIP
ncbi:VOC family protein [Chloroflexi bacterium TSY]|nr:VOC family protein [Chloroflexi bacterium TSY]